MNEEETLQWCKLDDEGYVVFPPTFDPAEPNIMNPHLSLDYLTRHGYEQHNQAWIDEHTRPVVTTKDELYTFTFDEKSRVAYTEIYMIKNGETYSFATDNVAETKCNSTFTRFTAGLITEIEWKTYKDGAPYYITLTKEEFLAVFSFAGQVQDQAFTVEGQYNEQITAMDDDLLADEEYIAEFKSTATASFNAINRTFNVDTMTAV